MSSLNIPNNITNGTPNDAVPVMQNFNAVAAIINGLLDSSNLDPGLVTGSGNVVLQTAPTLTNPTLNGGTRVVSPNWISNARLTLSAGVLKLVGDNGSDPSATNPVIISVPSSTAGKWDQITITSPTHCTIKDTTSGDTYFPPGILGETFGSSINVAWANAIPFMVYVATDGVTPVLFISRNPCAATMPGTNYIGYKGNPAGLNSQLDFYGWTATNVTVTHSTVPCYPIGTILMTKDASQNWTIGALSSSVGISVFRPFSGMLFTMPTGQKGASSGKYFSVSGGGTAPTYTTTNTFKYSIDLNGEVTILASFLGAGTAGAGGGLLNLHLPYTDASGVDTLGSGNHNNSGVSSNICIMVIYANTTLANFIYQGNLGVTYRLVGDDQSSVVTKTINGTIKYKGFLPT